MLCPRLIASPARALSLSAAALFVGLLAACASPPNSAPIVSRTTPPAAKSTPATAARPAGAAPSTTAAGTSAETAVQTAPVRPPAIESRGADGRPVEAKPTDTAQVPLLRSGPRGTKLPYSEANLAALRAQEPAASAASSETQAPAAASNPAPTSASAENRGSETSGDWSWPVNGKVVQGFADTGNKGVILGGKTGDAVQAAADGRVIFSGPGPRGYGNLVIVKHTPELLSVYAQNRTLTVKEGQTVTRGQKIAEIGTRNGATQLHFEIRQQGKPVDPLQFLPRR